MSNTARKARKRARMKFEREPKVGTPYQDRVVKLVQNTRTFEVHESNRQRKKNLEYHRITTPPVPEKPTPKKRTRKAAAK